MNVNFVPSRGKSYQGPTKMINRRAKAPAAPLVVSSEPASEDSAGAPSSAAGGMGNCGPVDFAFAFWNDVDKTRNRQGSCPKVGSGILEQHTIFKGRVFLIPVLRALPRPVCSSSGSTIPHSLQKNTYQPQHFRTWNVTRLRGKNQCQNQSLSLLQH